MSGLAASERLLVQEQHSNHTIPCLESQTRLPTPAPADGSCWINTEPTSTWCNLLLIPTCTYSIPRARHPFSAGKRVQNPSLRWPSLSNESNRQRGWCCLSILPPLCPPPGDSVCQPLSLSRGKGARVSRVIQVLEVQGNWKGRRKRSQQGKEQDLAVESPAWQQNRCSELGQMVPSCCQGASAWDSKRTRDPPRAEVCLMGWRMQESSA